MRTRSWRMRDTGRTVRTTIGDKPALCPLAQFSRQVHRLAPNIRTSPISRLGRFVHVEPVGNIPPADAEQRYWAMLDE